MDGWTCEGTYYVGRVLMDEKSIIETGSLGGSTVVKSLWQLVGLLLLLHFHIRIIHPTTNS